MRRRRFIAAIGATAAWAPAAHAQRPASPVVGFIRSASFEGASRLVVAFRQGLGETGYVEGRNVAIEFRSAEGRNDRLPELVADLLRLPVSVIVGNDSAALAARAATSTTPILFAYGGDPVRDGMVASLSRPGGNLTGVTFLGSTLITKQLELLHELAPGATVVTLLLEPNNPAAAAAAADARTAAHALGIRLVVASAGSAGDIDAAFVEAARQQAGAVLSAGSAFFLSRSRQIVGLAERHALPAVYSNGEFAAVGGLASYSGSITDGYRQIGVYAGRILGGARPADLPVVQGTRVELAINLRTARTLGLAIPPALLARADEVIE